MLAIGILTGRVGLDIWRQEGAGTLMPMVMYAKCGHFCRLTSDATGECCECILPHRNWCDICRGGQ